MQVFILLYIEAGSYIQEDEEKWEFVILSVYYIFTVLVENPKASLTHSFERRKRKDGTNVYHFIGYSSLYPFYFFPESTRLRLRYACLCYFRIYLTSA